MLVYEQLNIVNQVSYIHACVKYTLSSLSPSLSLSLSEQERFCAIGPEEFLQTLIRVDDVVGIHDRSLIEGVRDGGFAAPNDSSAQIEFMDL